MKGKWTSSPLNIVRIHVWWMTLQVVLLDLEVLAEISSSAAGQEATVETENTPLQRAVASAHNMNSYFTKFMVSLLKIFSTDRQLLEDRGAFIIRYVLGIICYLICVWSSPIIINVITCILVISQKLYWLFLCFICRQLCLLLNAEAIYRCFSEILLHEDDMKFASHMIQTLSNILLTSTELFELRTQLKGLETKVGWLKRIKQTYQEELTLYVLNWF